MRKLFIILPILNLLTLLHPYSGFPMEKDSEKFILEKDLSIGIDIGDENLMFGNISDIDLDTKENIYVLDWKNSRIQKFDRQGRLYFAEEDDFPMVVRYIVRIRDQGSRIRN